MSGAFKQRSALVFGGSRGIGAAAVSRLVEDGYAVSFTYVSRADSAATLVDEIADRGGNAFAIQADSTDAVAIQTAVDQAIARFGPLDVAVVNAGVFKPGMVDVFSIEDLDQSINLNFRGVFLSIQAAVPHINDGGRIITIGSNTAIRTGHPGSSVYQATKAAVAGLVKGLALDLAPRKITVNNIQPGPTETGIHNAATIAYMANYIPLKRMGSPEEIAGLVSYLAREESGFMTGSSLTIDGGYVL